MWYNQYMETECRLCPVACGADRTKTAGACGATDKVRIANFGLHPYEEPCISCKNGSGTVFFSGCSLRCVFCQNHEISRAAVGEVYDEDRLIGLFRTLEEMGAENINLVTASHYVPVLLRVFAKYRPKIPVVYNTHSYERVEVLQALDKYIDVYLPDLKYYSPKVSLRYTGKSNYFEYASRAIGFMAQREAEFEGEKMVRGCIVRHLILPLNVRDSIALIDWFAQKKFPAYFSLMRQYTPCGEIEKFPELQRRITAREYETVLSHLLECGLERVFVQERGAADEKFIPNFTGGKKLF